MGKGDNYIQDPKTGKFNGSTKSSDNSTNSSEGLPIPKSLFDNLTPEQKKKVLEKVKEIIKNKPTIKSNDHFEIHPPNPVTGPRG
ncbi:MAG: hypothetical protein HQK88_06925 [Nitrospirae bacterium]|nr:hypothetical protein [Nitrospirota bacterium]MBF0535027.1 hypothetical protein [Nitrospirota bacterium]MBF0616535.1 hypothetical protein [Nitrospirota bacterium]